MIHVEYFRCDALHVGFASLILVDEFEFGEFPLHKLEQLVELKQLHRSSLGGRHAAPTLGVAERGAVSVIAACWCWLKTCCAFGGNWLVVIPDNLVIKSMHGSYSVD